MIKSKPTEFERIEEVTCDSCGTKIPVQFGRIDDHLRIGGYHKGKLLEAVVCIKCMEEKMGFIDIQRKENTVGYC